MAHGGKPWLSRGCPGCEKMRDALGAWIADHAASEDELAELEDAART